MSLNRSGGHRRGRVQGQKRDPNPGLLLLLSSILDMITSTSNIITTINTAIIVVAVVAIAFQEAMSSPTCG